jgi:hypothetical protein
MARSTGDAALDFEMRMLLDTKEAEASAARLEKGLGGVLSIFESIGKAAISTVGMVGAALKAPADFDNFLGSLNTKISNTTGELVKYRDVVWQMQAANRKPGSSLFGASPEDFQKITMGFARGASEAEKYGKHMSQNLQGFALGAGAISKGIGIPMEETTGIITSFHRELGISYTGMEKFGKALTSIGRQSGMTATQTKTLFRTVTSLGRAYGLTGKNAEKFVLDSFSVSAAISKIGLDANEVLTKMNEVATGSEQGLIQSLLLGFKPSDPEGQLKAFTGQAKMITQMAGQAGEQFAPMLTRKLGDKLGLKNFSVEQIQAMSRGEMIESDEKKGETVQLDTLEVLKGIKDSQMDIARRTEGTYATFGQHMQEGFTKLITFLQEKFTPAMEQLKNMMANIIPRIIPILEGVWDVLKAISNKIMGFFNMGKSPLATLGIGAGILALIPQIPAILGAAFKIIGSLVGGLGSLLGVGGTSGAAAAGAGGAAAGATGLGMSVAAASASAIALTVVGGFAGGLLIGKIIDLAWGHFAGAGRDKFFDNVYKFVTGEDKDKEKQKEAIAIKQTKASTRIKEINEEIGKEVSSAPKKVGSGINIHKTEQSAKNIALETEKMSLQEFLKNPTDPRFEKDAFVQKLGTTDTKYVPPPPDESITAKIKALEDLVKGVGPMPSFDVPSMGGESPLMTNIDSTASQFNLRRTDKPGQVHVGDHKFARDFSLRKSEGSAEFLPEDEIKKIVASFDPKLYWAKDEINPDKNLPEEEKKKHVRHLHVQLREQYRGMAGGGFAGGALDNVSGINGLAVRDTEAHDILREIASKLGVSGLSASANTSQGMGTPRSDAEIAALTPLHINTSIWNDVQMKRNQLVSLPGGGLLGAS